MLFVTALQLISSPDYLVLVPVARDKADNAIRKKVVGQTLKFNTGLGGFCP